MQSSFNPNNSSNIGKNINHQEDDHSEVKKVKSKMQEEISKRTTATQTSLPACLLNPFSKDLTFVHEEVEILPCFCLEIWIEASTKMYIPLQIGFGLQYGPYAHFGYWTLVDDP